jgi:hypothetical protein
VICTLIFFQSYVGVMHKLFFCTFSNLLIAWCWCMLVFVFAVWVTREIEKPGNHVGCSFFVSKHDSNGPSFSFLSSAHRLLF